MIVEITPKMRAKSRELSKKIFGKEKRLGWKDKFKDGYELAADFVGFLGEMAFAQAYGLSTSAPAQGGYGGWFDGWKGFLVNFASWWGGYAVGKAVSALALGTAADAGRSALLSPVAAAEAAIDTGLASGFAAASGSVSAGLTAYGWIYGVDTSAWASFFGGVGSAAFSSARDFAQGLPESIFPTAKELAKAASTVADVIRPITPALAGFADVIATGATMVVQNAAWNLSPVARDMTLEFFLNARGFDL